jgi:hypothetical protein
VSEVRRTFGSVVDSMEAVARRQHGLITRRQALDAHLTHSAIRHLVRCGRWQQVAYGVYRLEGAPETDRQRLLAGILGCRGPAFACRTTAASLHGIPGFRIPPFHVLLPIGRTTTLPIVTLHRSGRLDPAAQAIIDGVPTTSITRTLFDLFGTVSFPRAERALDTALARRLVSPPELGAVFAAVARRGRLGSAGMRAFLEARGCLAESGPESELERRFSQMLARAGIPAPELQVDLGASDGWIGRVDAYFRPTRVVVELDGAEHHSSLVDRRNDAARDRALTDAGFRVVRFTWTDVVGHPDDTAHRLRAVLTNARSSQSAGSLSRSGRHDDH